MTTRLIVIVGASIASVAALYVMGWILNRKQHKESNDED